MNFIDEIVASCEEAETPRSFLWWAGVSTISAIASTNVSLNRKGVYVLQPNTFVLLIAESGLGKGLPINISKKLVKIVNNTRVISGRSTIEGILKDLSTAYSVEGSAPVTDSRGYIVSGEFATSLQRNPDALTILTDLYDTHYQDEWVNTLKTSPVEKLKQPCITLFSGASPAHFEDFIPKANLYGGFIGRTLLVHETKRYKINSLVVYDDEVEELVDFPFEELAKPLLEIKNTKGRFKFTRAAGTLFDEWDRKFKEAEHEDKTGTLNRMPDHVLKVAMCLSLANRLTLKLELSDVEEAIAACMALGNTAKRLTSGGGKSDISSKLKVALEILVTKSKEFCMSRRELLVRGAGDYDAAELDRIIEHLTQCGFITQSGLKEIEYKITEAGQNLWGKLS